MLLNKRVPLQRMAKHFDKSNFTNRKQTLEQYVHMRSVLDHPVIPSLISVYRQGSWTHLVQE